MILHNHSKILPGLTRSYPHDVHHIQIYAQVIHMTYITLSNVRIVIVTRQ
jgi:hypothetical protein